MALSTKNKTDKKKIGVLKKQNKWLNWKLAGVMIIGIAAVGAYQVFRSYAAVPVGRVSFSHGPNQMSGGTLVSKTNGTSYRNVKLGEAAVTWLSSNEVSNGTVAVTVICGQYLGGFYGQVRITASPSGLSAVQNSGGSAGSVCIVNNAGTLGNTTQVTVKPISMGSSKSVFNLTQINGSGGF